MGLVPGDRVLMRLANSVEFPIVFLGAIAAGLVPVPTSAQLTGPEVSALARALRPALIVAGPGVAVPDAPGAPVLDLAALRALFDGPPCDWDMGTPDRLAYIVYTSGTSGRPRGVMHAHRAVWARRMMWDGWYGLQEGDRLLHAGALNWTYTLGTGLLDPWAAGACALVPGPGVSPAQLPLLMRRFDVTLFAAAPGIYRQMLRGAGQLALPHLRHGLSAGEKMADDTRAAWHAATGTRVHEAFGMSECSTFLSGSPARPAPDGSSGHAQPGRRLALIGADGAPVPRGQPGVIAVHRDDPGLFLGYLDAEAETAGRFAGAWFLTGDLGVMDDDGAITYLGRDDDMMNAGGVRVSPLEVEAALTAHPAIQDAAACEVEVAPGVRVIAAFYVAQAEIPEATLAAFAAERLARYKQPRIWRRVPALPRGANNKLSRRVLRDGFSPGGEVQGAV
ncbi:benzoate--CoA ligase [Rhodobaculum claviforme]|uniref:Benzoate--CoA ligase n=2 Tax=Rhodobaculum claviforme TaxID=1549854 RepID=A0A934THM9_9RHOB|nr:benzoate--CoA ligase [Rhodobaculum claviforme]